MIELSFMIKIGFLLFRSAVLSLCRLYSHHTHMPLLHTLCCILPTIPLTSDFSSVDSSRKKTHESFGWEARIYDQEGKLEQQRSIVCF